MEEKFQNILTEDEKVIKITKAANSYITKRCIGTLIAAIFFLILFGTLSWALPWREVVLERGWGETTTEMQGFPWIVAIIVPGVFLFITLLVYIFSKNGKDNYFVCLTNKRIIIRSGAFTNDFKQYSIENVSGNITTVCSQSIFDRGNEKTCALFLNIELLPVGHEKLNIWTAAVEDGYEFAKQIEKVVKDNAKTNKQKPVKE